MPNNDMTPNEIAKEVMDHIEDEGYICSMVGFNHGIGLITRAIEQERERTWRKALDAFDRVGIATFTAGKPEELTQARGELAETAMSIKRSSLIREAEADGVTLE